MRNGFCFFLRQIALVLCVCVFANSVASAASKPIDAPAMKRKVESHGVGNVVSLTEADGSHVKGRIVAIDADAVANSREGRAANADCLCAD